jgi:SAM-dependent methyltransferase/uncharacterized protein YbaR (Trm112 family)
VPDTTLSRSLTDILRCPDCRQGRLQRMKGGLGCRRCHAAFPLVDGVVDFLGERLGSPGLAQRVMEARPVAAVYEEWFRPAFTALGSSVTYADEDAFLDAHAAPAGDVIVDLACGSGRYTRWLADTFPDSIVLGIDISWAMLRIAQDRAREDGLGNVVFLRADAGNLPLRDASVGHFNCFGALHLFPDAEAAIDEAGRVCADDASLALLTAARLPGMLTGTAQGVFSRAAKFRFFAMQELAGMLEHAGFADTVFRQKAMLALVAATRRARA